MKFYHKVEPEFIYTLQTTGSNFIVSWNKEGVEGSCKYSEEEVEDNFLDGTWIEVHE